jgi:hypothetical protein
MRIRAPRLLVCGAVAVAAGLGWSPAAHAAGLGTSLPAVTPSVSTAPPVSPSPVISTVDRVTGAITAQVVSAEQQTVARVMPTVSPQPATGRAGPATGDRAKTRAVTHMRTHNASQAPVAPQRPAGHSPGAAIRHAPPGPNIRVVPKLSPLQPPSGPLGDADAAGSPGVALFFVALASALSALAAPGLGRRLFPSLAEGHGFSLIRDLERPD